MSALPYIGIIVLIALSAFFSGAEIAYSSANAFRLKARARAEGATLSDKLALTIFERFDTALIAILIGNNLVNIGSSSLATVIAIDLMGDGGAWVATAVMTVLILIFGEIVPKIVASSAWYEATRLFAVPIRVIMAALKPLVTAMNWFVNQVARLWHSRLPSGPAITQDDLESIIDTVEDEGVMDEDRCDLLQSALDFGDVLAYEIITPRVDMKAVDIDDDIDDIMDELMESPYSRLPVYEDTVDNIIGILHLNRVFKRVVDEEQVNRGILLEMLMPAWFVHKTMPLDDVLSVMKRHKSHMVIVTDEYGGTMGVLTMEDVLEQLVGDIWDESDEIIEEFKKVGRDRYEADGDMRLEDFFDELELDYDEADDDNATVGGWAIEKLGSYPKVGDSFDYENITVTIKKRHAMRVLRVSVQVHELPDEDDDD